MKSFISKVVNFFAPPAKKSEDGRDQWGTRAGFVLAAMGGAVGLGNLLRYPSQVFNNHGAQWFIPYLIALFFLGLPVLLLELSLGQAYRGGCLIAFDHMNKRLKGVGLSVVFNGYMVVIYYVPLIAFIMKFFRHSFQSPLPWTGDTEGEFYYGKVLANVDPVEDGAYLRFPGTAVVGETAGWCLFVYFIVWLCICRGVGVTGRVVYFTMGLPIITIIILIGRSASLPNAIDGIKLYWGQWHTSKLAGPQIWQSALGQVFFSIGVGFGYFTCWSSYQNPRAKTVQDTLIIAFSNSAIEVFGAFAVFGVVGFLQMFPGEVDPLGTFSVAFLTYPQAIVQMPGANFWAILFFFTLFLLGLSSAFALLDVLVTTVHDTSLGNKYPRWVISTGCTIISYLISLPFCTEFGFYLLDAIDSWVNYLALFFVVWCECQGATFVYRAKDVIGQVGVPAFAAYNFGLIGGQILGVGVGHAVSPGAGAGVGFGVFVAGIVSSLFLAKTPDVAPPKQFAKNAFMSKFWYMAFYSGEQLRHDLNLTVASGGGWAIPVFWPIILRYITSPILAIVFSFAYPSFAAVNNNPLQIFSFTLMHFVMVFIAVGFSLPRFFDVFVPTERRGELTLAYAPRVLMGTQLGMGERAAEKGEGFGSSAGGEAPLGKKDDRSESPVVEEVMPTRNGTQ